MFDIMKKYMWEDIFGIKMFCMNTKLSYFDCDARKNLLVVFILKSMQFLSLIHKSTCNYVDHHIINGTHTLSI